AAEFSVALLFFVFPTTEVYVILECRFLFLQDDFVILEDWFLSIQDDFIILVLHGKFGESAIVDWLLRCLCRLAVVGAKRAG
ncbi:MAG: hypothetical protein MJ057_07720, partial [Sphaerochaetaceae bacterium]|nr:hypothetical protein [Sphaerochaetaceae bacterium]